MNRSRQTSKVGLMDEDGQDAKGNYKKQEIVISGQGCNVRFLNSDSAL
jgi:hypothetical protein